MLRLDRYRYMIDTALNANDVDIADVGKGGCCSGLRAVPFSNLAISVDSFVPAAVFRYLQYSGAIDG